MYVKKCVGDAVEHSQENREPDTVLGEIPDQQERAGRCMNIFSPKTEKERC